MIKKAFEIWKRKFETNQLSRNEYGWLASAANKLGMHDFAKLVSNTEPQRLKSSKFYDYENLTISKRK
ncbi:MAG: hypothetical protein RML72_10115 [Bacteroidia bacterium]|nr:hypothetical protein [Bacteroidia bacterium]